jgi:hypothetical protein
MNDSAALFRLSDRDGSTGGELPFEASVLRGKFES